MQQQLNNTTAPAIAQGRSLTNPKHLLKIYIPICQHCGQESNLLTFKRAEGNVTLCRRCAGELQ
jgi:predicted nucleic acid-binding Zn ribbon protein